MRRLIMTFFGAMLFSLLINEPTQACTDFKITAKDGTTLITRTLEFALDLKSNLRSSPRERSFNTAVSDGKPGLSWQSKYGYLYLDALNEDLTMDGMNEKGLSFEYLYLPGETQYQTVPAGMEKQAIPYFNFGDWVLGNFQSVDEVRNALSNVYVINQKFPGHENLTFPVHAAIYDATGKGIVVEFIGGKMVVYENNIGLMTNSPTYDWQVTNLRNYLNLSPYAPNSVTAGGVSFAATGQGSGMVGLPGDPSPPSRFVKIAMLMKTAAPTNNAADAVNLAEHIINNVDIPRGEVRAKQNGGNDALDLTQWTVFKDLTHKMFYYRTYDNMTLRVVDMSKVDFAPNAPHLKMPLENGPYKLDVTQQFLNQK